MALFLQSITDCNWDETENVCKNRFLEGCKAWLDSAETSESEIKQILKLDERPDIGLCKNIKWKIYGHSAQVSEVEEPILGSIIRFCIDNTGEQCSNIDIGHIGCETFNNVSEANRWLRNFLKNLPPGVTLTVSGNQTYSASGPDGIQSQQTSVTFTVACGGIVDVSLPACPDEGESCEPFVAHQLPNPISQWCTDNDDPNKVKRMSCCLKHDENGITGYWKEGVDCKASNCRANGIASTPIQEGAICRNLALENAIREDDSFKDCEEVVKDICDETNGTLSGPFCEKVHECYSPIPPSSKGLTCDILYDCTFGCESPILSGNALCGSLPAEFGDCFEITNESLCTDGYVKNFDNGTNCCCAIHGDKSH